MITLKHISKKYNSSVALTDFTHTFPNNKTSVLIGPSGCGKSTLIRIITGLVQHDAGEVEIDGKLLTEKNVTEFRHSLGYVIQEGGLFPHLTAGKNISLMAEYLGWDKGKIDQRIKFLSDLTKIDKDLFEKFPLHLSGGQRQRISLMRALMLDPDILLMDEPLGALDPLIRYELQTDLKNIFSELNKTVVMVTHDLSEASHFADEIILMNEGRIEQKGIIQDLLNNPKNDFVKRFVTAQRSITDIK